MGMLTEILGVCAICPDRLRDGHLRYRARGVLRARLEVRAQGTPHRAVWPRLW